MKRVPVGKIILVGFLVGVAVLATTGLVLAAQDNIYESSYIEELVQAAKAEGGVIYTYGMPETWANYGEVFKGFEEAYGIRQEDIDMGSSVVLSRMTAENASKNDIADLKPSLAGILASRGLTSDYRATCWNLWPNSQHGVDADTGSVWRSPYWGTLAFLVNTDLVKSVPHTWKDLEDPIYKGLVEYLDPRATGTGVNTIEAAAYAVSGDPYNYEAGVNFFKKLHDMQIIGSVDPLVTVAKFQRGETAILINFDYNLLKWQADNPQIHSVIVIPSDGTLSTGGGVVMAKNAPHPNTAKLFLEYLLCGRGQELYAKAFVHPMNPTTKIPEGIASKFPPVDAYDNAVFVDYNKDAAITNKLQDYYSKAMGGS